MANSPSHRFGQIIGDLLEEIMTPQLQSFCDARSLYLDKKGARGRARTGKKVTWEDKYGNLHDLDFVIEKDGSPDTRGRPLAFIEAAWRRYTKHSRNKAQEIQGAILPIAEQYWQDQPFLGAILAGVFTSGSLTQMRTSGFEVALFPYDSIIAAFAAVGIDAGFDEKTQDAVFQHTIDQIAALATQQRAALKQHLIESNQTLLDRFFYELQTRLDRQIERILLIPLHGHEREFEAITSAIEFVNQYHEESQPEGKFRKYEILVRYSNGDKIEAAFTDKERAIGFLSYIAMGDAS